MTEETAIEFGARKILEPQIRDTLERLYCELRAVGFDRDRASSWIVQHTRQQAEQLERVGIPAVWERQMQESS